MRNHEWWIPEANETYCIAPGCQVKKIKTKNGTLYENQGGHLAKKPDPCTEVSEYLYRKEKNKELV